MDVIIFIGSLFLVAVLIGVVYMIENICSQGGFHEWKYMGKWGITFQHKKCEKCGKLRIISQ